MSSSAITHKTQIIKSPDSLLADRLKLSITSTQQTARKTARLLYNRQKLYLTATQAYHYTLPVKYDKLRMCLAFTNQQDQLLQLLLKLDQLIPPLVYQHRHQLFLPDYHQLEFDSYVDNYHRIVITTATADSDSASEGIIDSELGVICPPNSDGLSASVASAYFNVPTDQTTGQPILELYSADKVLLNSDNKLDIFQELAFSGGKPLFILIECQYIWVSEEAYGVGLSIQQARQGK